MVSVFVGIIEAAGKDFSGICVVLVTILYICVMENISCTWL